MDIESAGRRTGSSPNDVSGVPAIESERIQSRLDTFIATQLGLTAQMVQAIPEMRLRHTTIGDALDTGPAAA